MSINYKTVRVTPDTYDRMHEIQKNLRGREIDSLPPSTRNVSVDSRSGFITLGTMLRASIEAYDRELNMLDTRFDLRKFHERLLADPKAKDVAAEFELLLIRHNVIQPSEDSKSAAIARKSK